MAGLITSFFKPSPVSKKNKSQKTVAPVTQNQSNGSKTTKSKADSKINGLSESLSSVNKKKKSHKTVTPVTQDQSNGSKTNNCKSKINSYSNGLSDSVILVENHSGSSDQSWSVFKQPESLIPVVHVRQCSPDESPCASQRDTRPPLPTPGETSLVPTGSYCDLCNWTQHKPQATPLSVLKQSSDSRYRDCHCDPADTSVTIRLSTSGEVLTTGQPICTSRQQTLLWTELYKPNTADQIIGNAEPVRLLHEWLLNNHSQSEESENAMVIYGPPGAGKTAAVYAVADELGYKVHEVNCGGLRDRASLLSSLREATLSHQIYSEKHSLILIEEIDLVFPSDKGFWATVYDLLADTRRPFMFTSNDFSASLDCPHDTVTFTRPTQVELGEHLRQCALCHCLDLPLEQATELALSVRCDIRQAFLTLQLWLSWSHPTLPRPLHSLQQSCDLELQCDIDLLRGGTNSDSWWSVNPVDSLDDSPMINEPAAIKRDCVLRNEMLDWLGSHDSSLNHMTSGDHMTRLEHVTSLEHREAVFGWQERVSNALSTTRLLSRVAMVTDLLPMFRTICWLESIRKATHNKRRFCHYLKYMDIDSTDLKHFQTIT